MKVIMIFQKKILFRENGPFRTENGASSQLWIHYKDCFTLQFCTMKEVKRDMEIIVIVFLKKKKKLFEAIWSFGPKMGSSRNFGSALSFF